MKISVTENNGQTVISVDGMLDSSSAPQFQEEVNELLDLGKTGDELNIAVDLANMSYTSSQGIRTILTLLKTVMARQGKLVFRNIQPAVKEVFDMAGISQAMVIE